MNRRDNEVIIKIYQYAMYYTEIRNGRSIVIALHSHWKTIIDRIPLEMPIRVRIGK